MSICVVEWLREKIKIELRGTKRFCLIPIALCKRHLNDKRLSIFHGDYVFCFSVLIFLKKIQTTVG